ncbi:MAG: type II secretion system protein GspG [Candidatus Paceibacterota bacterium]|jgi:hypothetical protein
MSTLLQTTLSLLLGATIMIGGVAIHADDIIGDAKSAVNGANVHQLATVLEIYYSDHNQYPNVQNGEELVNKLSAEGYIQNRPLDPTVFTYEIKSNGQDYSLSINK